MTLKGSSRSKLAQLVPDHIFGNEHFHVVAAVMHHERVPHKFRDDRTGTSPSLDRFLGPRIILPAHFLVHLGINEGPFFC